MYVNPAAGPISKTRIPNYNYQSTILLWEAHGTEHDLEFKIIRILKGNTYTVDVL